MACSAISRLLVSRVGATWHVFPIRRASLKGMHHSTVSPPAGRHHILSTFWAPRSRVTWRAPWWSVGRAQEHVGYRLLWDWPVGQRVHRSAPMNLLSIEGSRSVATLEWAHCTGRRPGWRGPPDKTKYNAGSNEGSQQGRCQLQGRGAHLPNDDTEDMGNICTPTLPSSPLSPPPTEGGCLCKGGKEIKDAFC